MFAKSRIYPSSPAVWTALLLTILAFVRVQAYYPYPNIRARQNMPFVRASSVFMRDRMLYSYGGEERGVDATNDFSAFTFQASSGSLIYQNVSSTGGPHVANAVPILLPDNNTLLLIGGKYEQETGPIANSTQLRVYRYTFDTNTWSAPEPAANGSAPVPSNRRYHAANLAPNGLIYIYGGITTDSAQEYLNDFWSYNLTTGVFTNLTTPDIPVMVEHAGIALPDETIVYFSGGSQLPGQESIGIAPMNSSFLYFTSNNSWTQITLGGDIPHYRCNTAATLGPDQKSIYIFGGNDCVTLAQMDWLNDVAVLDASTWTWTRPDPQGIPPYARDLAGVGILLDQFLIVYGGSAGDLFYNDINVLQLPSSGNNGGYKWIVNVLTGDTGSGSGDGSLGLSQGVIAAIVIVCAVAVLLILFILYRFRHRVKRFLFRLHYDFWKPRTGEPLWAESARLVTKLILSFLFLAFLVYMLIQVLQSPKATYTTTQTPPNQAVRVPDARICMDRFDTTVDILCITDAGIGCNDYIRSLDMSLHKPYFGPLTNDLTCYLFTPPDTFMLGPNFAPPYNNGSYIHFILVGDPPTTTGAVVHFNFYPLDADPNRNVYFGEPVPYMTLDITIWQNDDSNALTTTNLLDVTPNQTGSLEYQLEYSQYLTNIGWNYVGFASQYNQTSDLTSSQYTSPSNGLGQYVNIVTLKPQTFTILNSTEKKIYTLVNAVGFVGGLFGILVAFQTVMFGYRPRSPWGIVHRWSVGQMKRSISQGLRSRFDLLHNTPVPLVNPVHRRFSLLNVRSYGPPDYYDSESDDIDPQSLDHRSDTFMIPPGDTDEKRRLERVEERMQLLELLFKSYYIDDEVFRRLDRALKEPRMPRAESQNSSTSTRNSRGRSIFPFLGGRRQQRPEPMAQRDDNRSLESPSPAFPKDTLMTYREDALP